MSSANATVATARIARTRFARRTGSACVRAPPLRTIARACTVSGLSVEAAYGSFRAAGMGRKYPSSARVAHAAAPSLLVEPPIEVQALEHELGGRCQPRCRLSGVQAPDGGSQLRDAGDQRGVVSRRDELADLGLEALLLEALDECGELADREVAVEDVRHGSCHELLDDAVLTRLVAQRLQLDLARRRGNHRAQVAYSRRGGGLGQANRTLQRRCPERLVVGDRHAHGDAGPLADFGGSARQL